MIDNKVALSALVALLLVLTLPSESSSPFRRRKNPANEKVINVSNGGFTAVGSTLNSGNGNIAACVTYNNEMRASISPIAAEVPEGDSSRPPQIPMETLGMNNFRLEGPLMRRSDRDTLLREGGSQKPYDSVTRYCVPKDAQFFARVEYRNSSKILKGTRLPQPILALVHYGPSISTFAEPIFALYDDGMVIYFKGSPHNGKYMVAKLTDDLMSKLLDKVSLQKLESLETFYDSSGGGDDLSEHLMVRQRPDGTYKRIVIYGPLGLVRTRHGAKFQLLPPILREILEYLSTFDAWSPSVWIPDYIEVIIWPYDYFTEEDVIWPKDWPDLNDSRTLTRGDKHSLFIEKSKYKDLMSLLSSRRDGQGLRISGKAWAVTTRFPFPQEQIWLDIKQRN